MPMVSGINTITMFPATGGNRNDTPSNVTLEYLNDAEVRRLIPTIVYLVVLSVAGMLGNGLVCHVYRTRYRLSNSQCFILCLSAIDLFSSAVAIPLEVATIIYQYKFEHLWLCKLSRFFNTLGALSASFLLLFIAIDRYRKVCRPYGWQIKANVAKCLCLFSVILGLVFSWPAIFIYGKHTFEIPKYGLTGTECTTDDSMLETIFPLIYAALFGSFFIFGTLSVCILYCFIGHEIKRHASNMPKVQLYQNPSLSMHSSTMDTRISSVGANSIEMYNHGGMKLRHADKAETDDTNVNTNTVKDEHSTSAKNTYTQDKVVEQRQHVKVPNEIHIESQRVYNCLETATEHEPDVDSKEAISKDTTKIEEVQGSLEYTKVLTLSDTPYDRLIKPNCSRLSSRGSRIVRRMTTFISTTKTGSMSVVKTQYQKHAIVRKTAFLMFLITLAFMLSYMPHHLLMVVRQLRESFVEDMTDDGRAVYNFFLRSYFLNCAINPVIYGVCDTRFRAACKEIFSKCCHREGHMASSD